MQEAIINLLKKKGVPLGRSEIATLLKERAQKVTNRLTKMVKSNQVHCMEIDRFEAKKRFNAKRRTRLYYLPK